MLDFTDLPLYHLNPYYSYPKRHELPKDSNYVEKYYYVYSSETGERHPLFFPCPCGHCDECLTSKYSELSSRLQFEVLSYPPEIRTIFFTLTYDDAHLPSDGVCRSDITDFINRLHIYAKRSGLVDHSFSFRSFIVSEYGTDPRFTHRPHYHGLLFGLDLSSYGSIKLFNRVIRKAWKSRGRLEWEFARSSHGVSKYCTKYVIKGLHKDYVPEGKNPNFISYPLKSGGLGVNALKNPAILDQILNSQDGSILVNSINHTDYGAVHGLQRVRIPRFIIDKLFPTFSRFITSDIKRCLKRFQQLYSFIEKFAIKYPSSFEEVEKKFMYILDSIEFRSAHFKDAPLHEIDFFQASFEFTEKKSFYATVEGWFEEYEKLKSRLLRYKYSCDDALRALRSRSAYVSRFRLFNSPEHCDTYAYKHSFVQSCCVDSPLDAYLQL